MPKFQKSKFDVQKVTDSLKSWKDAAAKLETAGKKSYTTIRKYIPRYERSLTVDEKASLVNEISMFFFAI